MEHQSTARIEWIDVAKGLAIIMVTFFHANMVVEWTNVETGISADIHQFLASFRMPLFFTVSGFFASSAITRSWSLLWKHRLETYIWLFILWSTFLWIFAKFLPFNHDLTFGKDVGDLLKSFIRPIAFIWFFWCLAFFLVITKAARSLDFRPMLAAFMALSITGFWLRQSPVQAGHLGFIQGSLGYVNAMTYLIFFWAGSRFREHIILNVPATTQQVLLAIAIFALCKWGVDAFDPSLTKAALSFMSASVGVLILLALAKGCFYLFPTLGHLLRVVGSRTVPLYVLQVPIMWTLAKVLNIERFNNDTLGGLVHIPLALITILLIQAIDIIITKANLTWLFANPRA